MVSRSIFSRILSIRSESGTRWSASAFIRAAGVLSKAALGHRAMGLMRGLACHRSALSAMIVDHDAAAALPCSLRGSLPAKPWSLSEGNAGGAMVLTFAILEVLCGVRFLGGPSTALDLRRWDFVANRLDSEDGAPTGTRCPLWFWSLWSARSA